MDFYNIFNTERKKKEKNLTKSVFSSIKISLNSIQKCETVQFEFYKT